MAAIPIRTDRVRIILLMKRKDGLTREEFSHYWRSTHTQLFLKLDIVKRNILRYEEAHTDDNWVKFPQEKMGLQPVEWDGALVLDAESYEKIFEVFGSEEYQSMVGPDEANFVDRAKCQLLPVGIVTNIP